MRKILHDVSPLPFIKIKFKGRLFLVIRTTCKSEDSLNHGTPTDRLNQRAGSWCKTLIRLVPSSGHISEACVYQYLKMPLPYAKMCIAEYACVPPHVEFDDSSYFLYSELHLLRWFVVYWKGVGCPQYFLSALGVCAEACVVFLQGGSARLPSCVSDESVCHTEASTSASPGWVPETSLGSIL